MKRIVLVVAATVLLAAIVLPAAPVAADNFLQSAIGFLGHPDGTSLMFCHGRAAQAVGPAINFQLAGPLHLDLGLLTNGTSGTVRIVPGVSLAIKVRKATGNDVLKLLVNSGLELYGGIAWTPTEYGGTRIGRWEVDNVGLYGGLRKTF